MRADAVRNRAKIVQAAKAAFAETGLQTQMEDVARRAEVGVGTVYRHFPTKDALVRALIFDKMARLADIAAEALASDADEWSALESVFWRAGEDHSDDRALREVVSSQPQAVFQQAAEETQLAPRMAELVSRAQAAGVARPELEAQDVPLVMCGLAAVVQSGRDWRRYLTFMLDGFRAR
ncbi:MAG: TetR/AcrR family transcriptional regulator [Actinomycetota bacterium]|nr:TetR/AcrR family transcriptional regulator [Actinomycetota bacterium]MDQ5809022.1 TetR/AcrR family transcriptional regulator [Actinomycetota bacterium]